MMSRRTIYDVTPLQLEAAGYVEDLGPDELEEADALAAHCQAQVEARKVLGRIKFSDVEGAT